VDFLDDEVGGSVDVFVNGVVGLIVWDRGEKSYRRAVVTDVRERKRLQVRFGDKMAETRLDGGPSALTKKHVVAYENRDLLSDDEKWDIADEQFDLIPKGNYLDETAKDEINQVWREYTAAITNPDEAIELANNIKSFQKAAPAENANVARQSFDDRTVRIKLHNPDSEFPSDRSEGKTKTIRHEMMHAYLMANGYDHHQDARRGDWNKVKVYRHTNEVDFDYVERGGVSEITKYDIDAGSAKPTAYMMLSKNQRDDYDDSNLESPEWLQHIYDNTVAEAQDAGTIEYDGEYDFRGDLVFGPNPDLEEGGYVKVALPDHDGREIELRVVKGIHEYNDQQVFAADWEGVTKRIPVDRDTGQIIPDMMEFRQYAPESDVKVDYGVDPDDIASDPGFQRTDEGSLAVFAEALSRSHFRKAISSEVFFGADRSERYTDGAYSATNSQETAAKFAEVLFDDGLGRVYSQKEIENLYEHHEDLIWAANQHFVIPAYIRNELSVAVERDWEDIIEDLNRRYGEL